jgi:hypothetical protein
MEDVVALIVRDSKRGERAFLSWGRLHDSVDDSALIEQILRVLPLWGFHNVVGLEIQPELGAVRDFSMFFEGLLSFAARMSREDFRKSLNALASDDAVFQKSLYLLGPRDV